MLRTFLIALALCALAASLDSGSFNNNASALPNRTVNEGEPSTYQDSQFKDDLIKSVRNILGRLIGGQSIVCTSLSDGAKITLDGTLSGTILYFFYLRATLSVFDFVCSCLHISRSYLVSYGE